MKTVILAVCLIAGLAASAIAIQEPLDKRSPPPPVEDPPVNSFDSRQDKMQERLRQLVDEQATLSRRVNELLERLELLDRKSGDRPADKAERVDLGSRLSVALTRQQSVATELTRLVSLSQSLSFTDNPFTRQPIGNSARTRPPRVSPPPPGPLSQATAPGPAASPMAQTRLHRAIRSLKQQDSPGEKSKARKEVSETLRKLYDEKLDIYAEQIDRLETRLGNMKELLKKRRESADRIIELRLKLIEAEADGLEGFGNAPGVDPFLDPLIYPARPAPVAAPQNPFAVPSLPPVAAPTRPVRPADSLPSAGPAPSAGPLPSAGPKSPPPAASLAPAPTRGLPAAIPPRSPGTAVAGTGQVVFRISGSARLQKINITGTTRSPFQKQVSYSQFEEDDEDFTLRLAAGEYKYKATLGEDGIRRNGEFTVTKGETTAVVLSGKER